MAQNRVRFGFIPNPFAVPYFAAKENGFFAAEGLEIEETRFPNGSAVAAALTRGELDCGVGGHLQTMDAVLAGDVQQFICPLAFEEAPDHLCICLLAGNGRVKSTPDLAGATIGFSAQGAMSELQLRIITSAAGVDYGSLKVVTMPFSQMGQALRDGAVDAVSAVEPFVSQLVAEGAGTLLDRGSLSTALAPGQRVLITGVSARGDWAEKSAPQAAAVKRAILRGVDVVRNNAGEARVMIAAFTGVPAELAANMQLPAFHSDFRPEHLQLVFDLAAKFGLAHQRLNAQSLVANLD